MQELQAIAATVAPYVLIPSIAYVLYKLFPNLPKMFFD